MLVGWNMPVSDTEGIPVGLPSYRNATTIILCCDECGEPLKKDDNGNMDIWQFRGRNYHAACIGNAVKRYREGLVGWGE